MHPELDKLIRLQHAETELKRVESDLADIPRRKQELEALLDAERARLDSSKEALSGSQKNRRQQEGELQDLEQKRSRYKSQLMEVKTNKEYTAMLHEIETVEREVRLREDQILGEMESAETLGKVLKDEEAAMQEAEARHSAGRAELERARAALASSLARVRAERDAVAATIEDGVLELFQRVARFRGSGVAEARDEMCQVCHVKLRPQMYVDVKKNESIQQCPSCSRILYYEPPPPVVDPQP